MEHFNFSQAELPAAAAPWPQAHAPTMTPAPNALAAAAPMAAPAAGPAAHGPLEPANNRAARLRGGAQAHSSSDAGRPRSYAGWDPSRRTRCCMALGCCASTGRPAAKPAEVRARLPKLPSGGGAACVPEARGAGRGCRRMVDGLPGRRGGGSAGGCGGRPVRAAGTGGWAAAALRINRTPCNRVAEPAWGWLLLAVRAAQARMRSACAELCDKPCGKPAGDGSMAW